MNIISGVTKAILVILVTLFTTQISKAQESGVPYTDSSVAKPQANTPRKKPGFPKPWIRAGFGATSREIFIGGNVFMQFSDYWAIGIRGGSSIEINFASVPQEIFWDITPGVAYSLMLGSHNMISAVGGIGLAGGSYRGNLLRNRSQLVREYEKITFRSLGAAVELQWAVFIPAAKGLAFAISAFSTTNRERSISGYHIGILIGER